jgi:hypothetical protein
MIVWTPVAVNEKSLSRRKQIPAAIIGSSAVLRVYTGGLTSHSFALTSVPFATPHEARAWVESNKTNATHAYQLPTSNAWWRTKAIAKGALVRDHRGSLPHRRITLVTGTLYAAATLS